MSPLNYFLICCIILSGCATTDHTPAEVVYVKKATPYYTVKEGDSIESIAQTHGMSYEKIKDVNNLENDEIYPGQKLLVNPQKEHLFDEGNSDDHQIKISKEKLPPANQNIHKDDAENPEEENLESGRQGAFSKEKTLGTLSQEDIESYDKKASSQLEQPKKKTSFKKKSFLPVEGQIIEHFSKEKPGISIAAPKGTPVRVIDDGLVKKIVQIKGYGLCIMVQHSNGNITLYAHLDKTLVKENNMVSKCDKIATVGKSGGIAQPMLHFQVRSATKKPIDPLSVLG